MSDPPDRYFDTVQEAYIDLLLLEEFWSSSAAFRSWWLERIGFPEPMAAELLSVRHSVAERARDHLYGRRRLHPGSTDTP
jgi:nitroimidazol reductase NimA-like FMN-containing flavoprotein (pyridoxamine 5'-phosphate oxidase superfamily)